MLTSVVTSVLVIVLATPVVGYADGGGGPGGTVTVGGDNRGGFVSTTVTAPGQRSNRATETAARTSSSGNQVTCKWIENSTHLENEYLHWLGWGKPGGHWYDVKCSDGSVFLSMYVPPAPNNVPPDVVLAGALAQRAVNRLPLPVPEVQLNPRGQALVNLPEWFWVPRAAWSSLSQRTQAGPVWARVSARPTSLSWDPGDGSPAVTCAGPGTPYDPTVSASAQSTRCSYTYTHSSAGQPQSGPSPNDRFFTVTVTATWSVTWVGSGGASGQLPVISRSRSFPLSVAERQAVVTGGSG
jgi:hypothetical protein